MATALLCGECYLTEGEPAKIPTVRQQGPRILYGQLDRLPAEPDVILMWLVPHR